MEIPEIQIAVTWLVTITLVMTVSMYYIIHYYTCAHNKKLARQSSRNPDYRSRRPPRTKTWDYTVMKNMIRNEQIGLPAMFVDLDEFDANVRILLDMVRGSGKTLRVATKSIRCPALVKRIFQMGGDVVKGLMCYSVEEAELLSKQGFDDFYIAYPTVQRSDIELTLKLISQGYKVTLTVDCVDHIKALDRVCKELGTKGSDRIRVAIDLDTSYKLFSGLVRLGAHRSQVDNVERFEAIVNSIKKSRCVCLVGVMGYEAHVAGLPDDQPRGNSFLPSIMVRILKLLFYRQTRCIRRNISEYCRNSSLQLDFFNGGGTGNLAEVSRDVSVTEVTAGSGFLQAQLFDYYVNNKCRPAIYFALQATRVNADYITCQSGGFIASGQCSNDKFPRPFNNPLRLRHYDDEGYGEVQTPLRIIGDSDDVRGSINLGDPVFFRPAKSGEIGEHFNEYFLVKNHKVIDTVKTYRGMGYAFY